MSMLKSVKLSVWEVLRALSLLPVWEALRALSLLPVWEAVRALSLLPVWEAVRGLSLLPVWEAVRALATAQVGGKLSCGSGQKIFLFFDVSDEPSSENDKMCGNKRV